MTTIKEDQDSWRYRGLVKRDFQHTHNGPEVPRYRKKAKKNHPHKHKHEWVLQSKGGKWFYAYGTFRCDVCGKTRWLPLDTDDE